MTRETKIGLLVGLAFIIVIGILLSDQLMRSTEPPPAPREEVAENLRRGTTTPASHNRVAPPAVAAQDPSPDNAVPTREEIAHHAPPVTWVNVGPGGQNSAGPVVVVGGNDNNHNTANPNTAGQNPPQHEPTSGMVRREMADASHPNTPRSLVDEAAAAGETLIGPDGQPLRARTPLPPTTPNHPAPPSTENHPAIAGMKQYKAEPGDSLSKLALKQMGANTKANRDAIVKANPSLAADPNKIIIGVTYNIPAAATAVAAGNTPTPAPTPAPHPAAPEHPAPVAVDNIYVVQPGDNLTRIAKDHMGDLSTMAAIKELNKETVKNWDVLQVGTKLRMPGKPLASAN